MPGCYADAAAVLRGEFASLPTSECVSDSEASGSARKVYRVTDDSGDVVYKVEGYREHDNETEYEILSDHSDYEWAPPVSLFLVDDKPVLCMPYYENSDVYGVSTMEIKLIEDILDVWHIAHGNMYPSPDIHHGNYRVIGPEQVMVIDAAGNFNM